MAGVLTLLSVLYGLCAIGVTVLAARTALAQKREFARDSGTKCLERGVVFVARPAPARLMRCVFGVGACFAVGLAALIVFAVAGIGLDRPAFSTHYTLEVLGRTYEEANVALFALLPTAAAGAAALGAFALWRRLQMLSLARCCLTDGSVYGVSFEPHFAGCRPVLFELRCGDLTRLCADGRAVTITARARTIRCAASDPQALAQALEAASGLGAPKAAHLS